jgi:endonuclease/exonuclease/phosphatase family metal-dependent hydrolase
MPDRLHAPRHLAALVLAVGVAFAALALFGAAPAGGSSWHGGHGHHGHHRHHGHQRGPAVTVMTRNLYLGADIMRPITATQGLPADQQGPAFVAANTTVRAIVDQTSFPLRSKQLAREIAARRPDLIGLQELALWRHGPLDGSPATTVDYDFLTTLLGDLAALGQRYDVVRVQQESDVSGPAVLGGSLQNVRLALRDAILKRRHRGLHVLASGSENYATRINLSVAGEQISIIRGFAWADLRRGHTRFRFIDTHLESASSDVAFAQAVELLGGPAVRAGKSVILVCDCNSDPRSTAVDPGGFHADRDPYLLITEPGGFTDEWLRFAPAQAGFTSGLSELVNDTPAEAAARFDHRIDFVFGRRADDSPMPVDRAWVVGRDPAERTPPTAIGRLWPSDHAGVVVRLRP